MTIKLGFLGRLAGGAALLVTAGCAGRQHLHPGTRGDMGTTSAPVTSERIVNLGDSITDGHTYPLLIEQALREAGKPVPKFIGEGIGGDTAAGIEKRLDRDCFVHHPTLVMLSCGINDMGLGVSLAEYEASVTAIAERMRAEKVRLMLLTCTNLGPQNAAEEPRLQAVNAVLHRIATTYGLTVAEVYDRMQEARGKEKTLWEDGAHLNFAGYRHMVRAVLDAMGYAAVPVPTVQRVSLLPGVIPQWRVLARKEACPPLDAAAVAALHPDATWRDYAVPEPKPVASWWLDQERRRGVVVSLKENLGPATGFIAVAELKERRARAAWVNVGAECGSVWLNGTRVFGPGLPAKGWHPGGYRLPVQLQKGANRIVLETGGRFFLSVTDAFDW